MGKSTDDSYRMFIERIETQRTFGNEVLDPFGGIFLRQGGFINTGDFLDAVRAHLQAQESYIESYFDVEELTIKNDSVTYREWSASRIIFCQGDHTIKNKYFKNLPVRPLKGETLTIKTSWQKDVILNRGVYMVPETRPGEFRVGATYQFNVRTPGPTQAGLDEIIDKLNKLLGLPFEVTSQGWGIRPTTNDRRPLIGCHPESDRLVIFNGLGTKGVSLAPYFSEVLIRWLENTGPLSKDVALTRFK
jgi:glycine/D-amino acid oxidase-like deaminating enzyme